MTDTIIHECPAPGWGISHYHSPKRSESDYYSIVTAIRVLDSSALLSALDHERANGWRLVSHWSDNSGFTRYIFERIND